VSKKGQIPLGIKVDIQMAKLQRLLRLQTIFL